MVAAENMGGGYGYKFSFVMPVYNVEDYLEETIESILAQTLDFKSSCQLIFINDGSADNSSAICKKYKELYPDNIIYIEQKNQGVSAARNAGVAVAEGKYISFLDSDDLISPETLEKVYGFFEKHYDEIDVVGIKLEFFEGMSGPHPLNYKFHKTRVVDIEKEYGCIHLSGGASFIKTEAIKGKFEFDKQLAVAEDAKLVIQITLEKMAWGAVAEPTYYYRKRGRGGSAIDTATKKPKYYRDTIKRAHTNLVDYTKRQLGYVPRYVQYFIMYDLQWRFRSTSQDVLSAEELDKYKKDIYKLLQEIDDDIIMQQKNIPIEYKLFILAKKYKRGLSELLRRDGDNYYINDTKVYSLSREMKIYLEIIKTDSKSITLEGQLWVPSLPGVEFNILINDQPYKPEIVRRSQLDRLFLGEYVAQGTGFRVTAPAKDNSSIKAVLRVNKRNFRTLSYVAGSRSGLQDFKGRPYRVEKERILYQPDKKTIIVQRKTKINVLKREVKYLISSRDAFQERRIKLDAQHQRILLKDHPLALRLCYFVTKAVFRKKVWIVSDRVDAAGDNGEAFFRHIQHHGTKAKAYFAISKTSGDYSRMMKYGSVVDRDSWYFKLLFLHADKIISSHADDIVINAFGSDHRYIRDLLNFDFVFLQHGIIFNDLSSWLDRYKKNIKLFITSAAKEYDSIIRGDYSYGREEVVNTGLPRYDLLNSKSKRKIIIAPTWRRSLTMDADALGKRYYREDFVHSEYYQFYNNILNDQRIITALENSGGVMEFYLHPIHAQQAQDFTASGVVKVMDFPYSYQKAFREGSLLVTDYSSVAFDFAYTKKPVLYAQFDRDTFYKGQVYNEGYFSYENDGFGPVKYDYETTVKEITKYIKNGYVMSNKYRARVKDFFTHNDKSNSQRVYEAIIALDKGGRS